MSKLQSMAHEYTIEDVCKDTLANYISKLQFQTLNALRYKNREIVNKNSELNDCHAVIKQKEEEIKSVNVKFAEFEEREIIMVKLIRDERVRVKLLEDKIELISKESVDLYDARIVKEVERMLEMETEDAKTGDDDMDTPPDIVNMASKENATNDTSDSDPFQNIQMNLIISNDQLNSKMEGSTNYEINSDYVNSEEESDYEPLQGEGKSSPSFGFIHNMEEQNNLVFESPNKPSDAYDDTKEEIDSEHSEGDCGPTPSSRSSHETSMHENHEQYHIDVGSSDITSEKIARLDTVDDTEKILKKYNTETYTEDRQCDDTNVLIDDKVERNYESVLEHKEVEYINKLLEDDDEIEETIEDFEKSFSSEFDEFGEFELPVEEETRGKVIENKIDKEALVGKRKRKQTDKYADEIMSLKEAFNTRSRSSKKMKSSMKTMNESLDSSFTRKSKNCKSCVGCKSPECEICRNCLDKPKFGGKNKIKQKCVQRKCINLI